MNISEWNRRQTTIGHLKAHYSGAQEEFNRTVLRLRVERLLNNIDLHPPGLSSGAILIVRRLDGPAAVGLSVSTQAGVNLQEFLRSRVAALYAAAARPALDAVPLDAFSVLFADPGEMLTCLTRDLLNRQTGEHWYWQQVLRNVPRTPDAALPVLWCEQANHVPTVLASLRSAEVLNAIAQLTPLAVKQVIRSLHEHFDLPPEMLTAITRSKPGGESSGTRAVQDEHRVDAGSAVSGQVVRNAAPWEQWLPNTVMPDLAPEARYLFGLGLALYSAPAFARSTRFAAQAVRWLQAAYESRLYESKRSPEPLERRLETGEQTLSPAKQDDAGLQVVPLTPEREQRHTRVDDTDASDRAMRSATLPVEEKRSPVASAGSNDDIPLATKLELSSSSAESDGRGERVLVQSQGPAISAEPELVQQESQRSEAGVSTELPEAFRKVQLPASQATAQPAAPGETKTREFEFGASKALPVDGVATHLGGVLYLINLLTWLGLPHSWDNGCALAEHMSGWAIVEALSRGLLGDLHEQYIHDPIWHALALLDGREPGIPIAVGAMLMEEDKPFHLPSAWLKHYGSASWSAFQDDERLLLCDDAAGFLIADVPLRNRTFFEVAHAEVEAYCDQGLEVNWHLGSLAAFQKFSSAGITSRSAMHVTPPGLERGISAYLDEDVLWWLRRVLGFVCYLLARALGEPLDGSARLAELVLCRHGQLIVSRTHVDLHMSMEEISIAVRRAGLDCDPGWVPDLARIVSFHFD